MIGILYVSCSDSILVGWVQVIVLWIGHGLQSCGLGGHGFSIILSMGSGWVQVKI